MKERNISLFRLSKFNFFLLVLKASSVLCLGYIYSVVVQPFIAHFLTGYFLI